MNQLPAVFEYDTSPTSFIQEIFKTAPKEPFSFYLTLPEEVQIRDFLANFIVSGADSLYHCQLADLTPDQIEHLRQYLLSIGWDVEYQVESRQQSFPKNNNQSETVTRQVNYYLIDFKPADPALRPKI